MHTLRKHKTHIIKFSLSFQVKTKNQKQLTEYLYIKRAKFELKSGKPKHKIGEIQGIKKLLFCLDLPSLLFGFRCS
jgi:hypothetical protein